MSDVAPAADPAPSPAPAAAPAAEPTPAPAAPAADPAPIGVKGNADPVPSDWTSSFNDDTKNFVSERGFKDAQSVVDSFRNLEKLRGVRDDQLLKIPDAEDSPQWNDVYTRLGKPNSPEEYGLQASEGDESGFIDWAKQTFHDLNLTTHQAQTLVEKYNEFNQTNATQSDEAYAEIVQTQEASLKKEWGSAYHQNIANAQAAAKAFDIQGEAIDAMEKSMGFDGLMKFLNNIGTKIGEAAFHSGEPAGRFGSDADILTPSQAKAKIGALKRDSSFTEKYIAGDTGARDRMQRLHKMAYPDEV